MNWKDILTAPLSTLYATGVWLRHLLYDEHVLRARTVKIPTICVGNLAVGGTGKTPHVEALIRMLAPDFRVAVLSRGYRRRTHGFVLADDTATERTIGDEAMQIYLKFPEVRVAVCENRVRGIQQLMKQCPDVEVVLLDDAFQHRRLQAGYNIILTPYDRLYKDDHMLPWGRLRDLKQRVLKANAVIVTNCPEDIQPIDKRVIDNHLRLPAYLQLYFSQLRYGQVMLQGRPLVVTGIAHPQYLMEYVRRHFSGAELMAFPDHHRFSKKDQERILARSRDFDFVLTTEKDLVRMHDTQLYSQLANRLQAIPIEVDFGNDTEAIAKQLTTYIRESQKQCSSSDS
ncbi:MAG: tetraacyldisaccharide 4'-kinase [Paludibacteraceae bacterium]|nr:tetraacyldisaccharide 4'-kinase [Paludibacteraceae bacterium]